MEGSLYRNSKLTVKNGREVVFIEEIGSVTGSTFKMNVSKYANGLINSKGGILYFGVDRNGYVVGDRVSRKSEDKYRLTVDHAFGEFKPFVPAEKYRIKFYYLQDRQDLCIIELKVSIGDLGELYEDAQENVYVIDNAVLYGPLYPQALKDLVLLKYKEAVEGQEEAKIFMTPSLKKFKQDNAPKKVSVTTSKLPAVIEITESLLYHCYKLDLIQDLQASPLSASRQPEQKSGSMLRSAVVVQSRKPSPITAPVQRHIPSPVIAPQKCKPSPIVAPQARKRRMDRFARPTPSYNEDFF